MTASPLQIKGTSLFIDLELMLKTMKSRSRTDQRLPLLHASTLPAMRDRNLCSMIAIRFEALCLTERRIAAVTHCQEKTRSRWIAE
jgi:hypothetical protein